MKTIFGVYGSGWRAEFFLRAAKALPDLFDVAGVITRNPEKAAYFTKQYGVRCFANADDLFAAAKPEYMVVAVSKTICADIAISLMERGVPVLMETPAASDLMALDKLHTSMLPGAKLQIAEQYPFQPMNAARLAFIKDGKLGNLQQAHVSFTQGYHAIALLRKYLGLGFENCEITAVSIPVSIVAGPGRAGEPTAESIIAKNHTVAVLDFGGKSAIFNFEADQHRSWIRSQITQIKGERGELFGTRIKYLIDYKTPVETDFVRKNLGEDENLEGYDLKGIIGDGRWYYRNPYQGSRLADDEIAVASCMDAMARYVRGGDSFYSLAEASQDLYLSLMIEQAAEQKVPLRTETQRWAK
jgi:predicted dehydrogenase